MIFLSIKLKTQDSFNTMYFLIMTLIIFTSSIYYPIENLPWIFKELAIVNPLSWFTTDIGRSIYLNTDTSNFILKLSALFILFIIVFISTNRLFDKEIKK